MSISRYIYLSLNTDIPRSYQQSHRYLISSRRSMAALAGVSGVLSAPRFVTIVARSEPSKPMAMIPRMTWRSRAMRAVVAKAAPDGLSEKVAESIKEAETACSENPASGECVAAWDEVEELSAAASHARDRQKTTDPLEEYCKDNPEVEECRTYED